MAAINAPWKNKWVLRVFGLGLGALWFYWVHWVPVMGESMEPAVPDGSVVISRNYFPWEKPQKGQIVISKIPQMVFEKIPKLKKRPPNYTIVKRVTAVEGEVVNNQVLAPETYWLTGENRKHSADSRFFGPVPRSDLINQVVFVVQPFWHAWGWKQK